MQGQTGQQRRVCVRVRVKSRRLMERLGGKKQEEFSCSSRRRMQASASPGVKWTLCSEVQTWSDMGIDKWIRDFIAALAAAAGGILLGGTAGGPQFISRQVGRWAGRPTKVQ